MLASTSSILLASVLLLLGGAEAAEPMGGKGLGLGGRGKHGSEMRRGAGGKGHGHGGSGRAEKRQGSNARMTYYYTDVGLGACGQLHQNDEYTVAMNTAQFNNGGVCGQTITITYNGNTASALVADECPTCSYGELDLSPGLFTHFASTDAGQIYGSWVYGSGSTPDPTTTTTTAAAPTTTTTTKEADPTTTSTSKYVAPTTSSSALPSSSAIPSSSAAQSASASASASSLYSSASETASVAAASASATAGGAGGSDSAAQGVNILVSLGQAVNGLGSVVCLGNEGCVV